jgi:hypothetical protein
MNMNQRDPHLDRHSMIVREIQGLRKLDREFADLVIERTPLGFAAYGEHNHHSPKFRPLDEAIEEASDVFDLAFVHTRERVGCGNAKPLEGAEAHKLFNEAEYHFVQFINRLVALRREVEDGG